MPEKIARYVEALLVLADEYPHLLGQEALFVANVINARLVKDDIPKASEAFSNVAAYMRCFVHCENEDRARVAAESKKVL
jgi:hypothetical protein